MPAIRAINSKDLKITNCIFSGFGTDIELDNVDGFISDNNSFSQKDSPQILIDQLINSIKESNLDESSKKRLCKEIFSFLSKENSNINVEQLKGKILRFLGSKAVDYFIQLAAAVTAGLALRLIKS